MKLSILRTLILTEVGLLLVIILMEAVGLSSMGLDPVLTTWLDAQMEQEPSGADAAILLLAVILFAGLVFAWFRLWKLKPYSRALYVLLFIPAYALYPALGPYVSNGWAEILNDLSSVVSGMIIAVLYFTDVYPSSHSGGPIDPDLDSDPRPDPKTPPPL